MPTYVYKRPDGTLFEAFQKMSDPALTVDPDTGVPVVRVISGGAGLQFKGTGFYLTDYPKSGASATASATDEASSSGSKEKTSAKPEASPAATPSVSKD